MPAFSVMAVDDNPLVTQALERWFAGAPGIRWLGSASDAADVPAMVARRAPDVLLLDVDMPGSDTFALLRRLVAEYPTIKVVLFSGHVRAQDIEAALGDGAWGYIVKDEPGQTIMDLLTQVAEGQCVLSPMAAAAWSAAR